jgi:pyruvate/2-oxoglutarate dehydrogenase complex dihydrolipoamide acyltransferase (E2) component
MVPIIAAAENKSIPDLAREINGIAQRARNGQLSPMDSAVASFVITNTGKFGQTLFGTPTIKPPNVGILAFEAIMKRPVALDNDEVVARPVMHVALTADHRAVDGSDMTDFVGKVKHVLENLAF